jgi:hypothetical protein
VLLLRAQRLLHPMTHVQTPPSRTHHHVSALRLQTSTDSGMVVRGLSGGQRPCVLQGKAVANGVDTAPVAAGTLVVTPGLSLDLSVWRNAEGEVKVGRAARIGNQEQRTYLFANSGLGIWPTRPQYLGLRADGGAKAPVELVWLDGAPALRNLSLQSARCGQAQVPVGSAHHLAPGQLWTLQDLWLEVTDDILRGSAR